MKNNTDDNVRQQLLDKLSEESTMVIGTAYAYAKNYVLYGVDITKAWTTVVQQASALERVKLDAFAEAYDSFKKDYENRLKADMVAILTEIQLEIEELDPFGDEWSDSLDACNDIIQRKIDALKGESEDDE